jgi:hypothetical protein
MRNGSEVLMTKFPVVRESAERLTKLIVHRMERLGYYREIVEQCTESLARK